MNKFFRFFLQLSFLSILLGGCTNDYLYVKESPGWMGDNIYATLKKDGRFTTYVNMLSKIDTSYTQILSRTGSRTVFVPTDSAFNVFFQDNPYGYHSVDDISKSMITTFVTFYTLENAYVTSVLGSSVGPVAGNCLRRTTTMEQYTIPYVSKFPDNPQFAKFKGKSMYLMTPNKWTLINFTQPYFNRNGVVNEDFTKLYTGSNRKDGDVYIFNAKIIDGDITNKNGYIHALDKVVLPPASMYECMRDNDNISIFRRLVERFCQPKYDVGATSALHKVNPTITDSVYTIDFFNATRTLTDALGNQITVDPIAFSPAENGAQGVGVGSLPNDMPVMFVPSDQAMMDYLKNSYLSGFGSWDNVPDDIIAKFVNTHLKKSFINSLPHKIESMIDDVKGDLMELSWPDVTSSTVCRNGVVNVIDKVVAPRDFRTVVAPILKDSRTKIMNWLINNSANNTALKFNYYLTSLESGYVLFIPIDGCFTDYIDPVYYKDATKRCKYKFRYDDSKKTVVAVKYNMSGDSTGLVTDLALIQNRLADILDYHIVVMPKGQEDMTTGATFMETKGGSAFKISDISGARAFQGAGNIENSEYVNILNKYGKSNGIDNGTTYIVDKRIANTITSPYLVLKNNVQYPDFADFYSLLSAFNDPNVTFFNSRKTFSTAMTTAGLLENVPPIFFKSEGLDYNIPFFGQFNYTILVPTKAAIEVAIANGEIQTVDQINAIVSPDGIAANTTTLKIEAIKKMILFLKNHFVDYSTYSDFNGSKTFSTAAKDPVTKRFNEISITGTGNSLIINKDLANEANTVAGHTDIMSRQYRITTDLKNIATSSRVVIHSIGHVLTINQ